jgi:hypothetical protein
MPRHTGHALPSHSPPPPTTTTPALHAVILIDVWVDRLTLERVAHALPSLSPPPPPPPHHPTTPPPPQHYMPITAIDFSPDGLSLRSSSSVGMVLHFRVDTGAPLAPEAASGVDWVTQCTPVGWAVQGLWPPLTDGSAPTATDRSCEGGRVCGCACLFVGAEQCSPAGVWVSCACVYVCGAVAVRTVSVCAVGPMLSDWFVGARFKGCERWGRGNGY